MRGESQLQARHQSDRRCLFPNNERDSYACLRRVDRGTLAFSVSRSPTITFLL